MPPTPPKDPSEIYDRQFFEDYFIIGAWHLGDGKYADISQEYAKVANILGEQLAFNSVIDVGCGPGLILERLRQLEYDVTGLDGSKFALEKAPKSVPIQLVDLTTWDPAPGDARDLVICSELLEHIPAEHADKLVDTITSLARERIFLTAATPGQGGHGHVNEQPNSYWIEKVTRRGFRYDAWGTDRMRAALAKELRQTLTWFAGGNTMLFERTLAGPDPEPTISIIVPCFNQAHFLRGALKSIRQQTVGKIHEIIVITPDADQDSTTSIIARHYDAIVVRDPAHGLAHARNLGIQVATGQMLVTLDADDELDPTYIEKVLPLTIGAGPHIIIATDLQEFDGQEGHLTLDDDMLARGYTPQICMFSKKLWEAVGGYDDGSPVEDWAFWLDCHDHRPTLRRVPERLVRYRRHAEQLTNTDPRPAFLAATRLLRPKTFPPNPEDLALVKSKPLQDWARKRLENFPTNASLLTLLEHAPKPISPARAWKPDEEPTIAEGRQSRPVEAPPAPPAPPALPAPAPPHQAIQSVYAQVIQEGLRDLRAATPATPIAIPDAKPGRSRICLCMIVKNEAHVIERCLASLAPSFDTWCIVDTGSTDGTQERIKTLLQHYPGILHERPWVDFEHNRNEAIRLAEEQGTEYLLVMDADDVVTGAVPRTLDKDVYFFVIRYSQYDYKRPHVFRSHKGCKYVGELHEYLETPGHLSSETFSDDVVGIKIVGGGARSNNPKKFEHDAEVLERVAAKRPNDGRPQFYLAQSYKDSNQREKAIEAYRKRAEMGGLQEEVFISLLEMAKLLELQERPREFVVKAYLNAYEYRPTRPEPLYHLGRFLRLGHGEHPRRAFAAMVLRDAMLLPKTNDYLYVDHEIRAWRAMDEYAINLFWLGRHEEALRLAEDLLKNPTVPSSELPRLKANLDHSLRALGRLK